jgi:hypothetical protein
MIRAWLILTKHWEYDDSFYNFVGHHGLHAICFSRQQAEARVRKATANFVRQHPHDLDRYEHLAQGLTWQEREQLTENADSFNDDAAIALAQRLELEPFTIQEVVITPEFLNTAALSEGKRSALLRKLAEKIRPLSPEAADHLESGE